MLKQKVVVVKKISSTYQDDKPKFNSSLQIYNKKMTKLQGKTDKLHNPCGKF